MGNEEYYELNAYIVHVKMHVILPKWYLDGDLGKANVMKKAKEYMNTLASYEAFISYWEVESLE